MSLSLDDFSHPKKICQNRNLIGVFPYSLLNVFAFDVGLPDQAVLLRSQKTRPVALLSYDGDIHYRSQFQLAERANAGAKLITSSLTADPFSVARASGLEPRENPYFIFAFTKTVSYAKMKSW
jgi:hypothetical protein